METTQEKPEVPVNTTKVPEVYQWEETSESISAIGSAMSKLQGEKLLIKKTGKNPHFDSEFMELWCIVAASFPLLNKHNLCVVQTSKPINGKLWLITRMIHGPSGEWIKGYWPMTPERKGQQALGSEHTYARRRGLEGIIGLAPSDGSDDDGEGEVMEGMAFVQQLERVCEKHEIAINEFLRSQDHINQHQTFRDVPEKLGRAILKRPNDLIAKAAAYVEDNASKN